MKERGNSTNIYGKALWNKEINMQFSYLKSNIFVRFIPLICKTFTWTKQTSFESIYNYLVQQLCPNKYTKQLENWLNALNNHNEHLKSALN